MENHGLAYKVSALAICLISKDNSVCPEVRKLAVFSKQL